MFNPLLVALILFLLASIFKISYIYTASYILFAIYLLATFWSQRNANDLQFARNFQPQALFGDEIDVTLVVENRGWLPVPWLRVHDRLPIALITPPFYQALVPLQPRERRTFTYRLSCRQRGWYEIGPLTADLGDVFGLSSRKREFSGGSHLTVYPKILSLDELGFPSKSPFGNLRTRQILYEDPSRIVGVREYQAGDSLRKINWKVTASSGRLQVRKLEPAMTLQTVVLLNVSREEYDRATAQTAIERAIVVAASIVNHLGDLRQEVGLLSNGTDPTESTPEGMIGYLPRKGRGQVTSILDVLGRLSIPDDRSFCALVRSELQRLPWGATLVVVTSRESEDLLQTMYLLHRTGFTIVLVYVDCPSDAEFDVARQKAAMLGLAAYRIQRDEDVEIWRKRAQTTA